MFLNPEKMWSKKCWVQKDLGPKKVGPKKISLKNWCQNEFGVKEITRRTTGAKGNKTFASNNQFQIESLG